MTWFHKGADQGDPSSMYGIATLQRRGEGVTSDAANARDWYVKAWQRGLKAAEPWATTPISRWATLGRKRACMRQFPDD
jgi:TPR repeat protein